MNVRRHRGFTLIEMVVTVALVSVMALAATPFLELTYKRTRETELRIALREIRAGIDAYKRAADQGSVPKPLGSSGYPPSLEVLVQGIPNARDPRLPMQYFLRRIPRDPFTDPVGSMSGTWALRSFTSPPDAPTAGSDVFDVASRSPDVGLNGVPYSKW